MSFHHESLFYAGEDGFVAGTLPFLRAGLDAGEAILVAVAGDRQAALEDALGRDGEGIEFVDMPSVGRNPARIIPVWQRFVDEQTAGGRSVRGIGEPVWPGRTAAEMAECHRHEALVNVAFDDGPSWRLMCPYDTTTLDADVIEEARRTHPHLVEDGACRHSVAYERAGRSGPPLGAPPADAAALRFSGDGLVAIRAFVGALAERAGLSATRAMDLVFVVNELVTNSLCHASGDGSLHVWQQDGALVCEVSDGGRIDDPLAGRHRPTLEQVGGRGLWLVNQLCDLVELRSSPSGTSIRVRMDASAPAWVA